MRSITSLLASLAFIPWLALMSADSGLSEPSLCAHSGEEKEEVAGLVGGDAFLTRSGRAVRLAGIEIPGAEYVRSRANVSDLADTTREFLQGLVGDAEVSLTYGEIRKDRHGTSLAHVWLGDGTWIQAEMIGAGLGRARAIGGEVACLDRLVRLEQKARQAGKGIWRDPEYAILASDDPSLVGRKGLYVLVEGQIVSVGRGRQIDFLNFGHNWRQDFTVLMPAIVADRIAEQGISVESLAQRRVRVRGVIEENGGPQMRLNDPAEIEVLDEG